MAEEQSLDARCHCGEPNPTFGHVVDCEVAQDHLMRANIRAAGFTDADIERAARACPAGEMVPTTHSRLIDEVRALADRLLAFDDAVPSWVDVPDDYEGGLHQAGRDLRALLVGLAGDDS